MAEEQTKQLHLCGIETGGTSINVAFAKGSPTNVTETINFLTTTPEKSLAKALKLVKERNEKEKIDAIGIGSFGPVDLRKNSNTYGYITSTPKPGWKYTNVVSVFKDLNVPIGFDTDVNAAALSEVKHGGHKNIDSCCYVTIGTGIGVGVVVRNKAVHGLMHPEAGHMRVVRHPKDTYKGRCPFHKDCLEGLATANAIADRKGLKNVQLLRKVPTSDPVFEIEAFYLAQLCATLTLVLSPHVIVLGGGIGQRIDMFPNLRKLVQQQLNGYVDMPELISGKINSYITQSKFDKMKKKGISAGIVGALELARVAYEEEKEKPATSLRSRL
eukprot:TRINITY_DN10367_c0_g1_i1.p1 TRINITY_DN10367_c0_g1~~TRINITY_DN10367_c0_g1_i1.p1  ORF type:complete len:337 (-),score=68.34 TRINITY_DN10367_c0_g1_i1:297-1280(-)